MLTCWCSSQDLASVGKTSQIFDTQLPSSRSWLPSFYLSSWQGISILAKVKVNRSSLHLPSSKALLSGTQGHVSGTFFLQFWARSTINCMQFVLTLTFSVQGDPLSSHRGRICAFSLKQTTK